MGQLTAELTVQSPAAAVSEFDISTTDPNVLLIGLGIEIEKRLRQLAEKYDIPVTRPPIMIARQLGKRGSGKGVLSDNVASALIELLTFRNEAAHGAKVEPRVAEWVKDMGPDILTVLDAKLRE